MNRLEIHPDNPQPRRIRQVADCLAGGGLIAYPADSGYAFGWRMGDRQVHNRVVRIRRLGKGHNFTLVLPHLKAVSRYAMVGNSEFRLLKKLTPGPYTFILPATREVPKQMLHPRRRAIGIRIPTNPVAHDLLMALDEPICSSSLLLPDEDVAYLDVDELYDLVCEHVDLFVDSGPLRLMPSTVLDLREQPPTVVRLGAGPVDFL